MTPGRTAIALYALVLALAIAACGLVATHARTEPATGGDVIRIQAGQERSTVATAEDGFHVGRVLNAKRAKRACVKGKKCLPIKSGLPYVPPDLLTIAAMDITCPPMAGASTAVLC